MLVTCPSIIAMFFVTDHIAQAATSLISFAASMPLLTLAFATLSLDMTLLVVRTFEFWFLTAVNLINTIVFFSMFRDIRIVGIVSSSVFYQLTLFSDANLRTRLIELRFLVFGAPAMVLVVLACVFHVTPGLHYASLSIFGASMADVDLLLYCNFIVAFFTMGKTHRNRHLLSSKHCAERHIVQCQMYFPTCQLVVADSNTVTRLRIKTADETNAFTRRKTRAEGTIIEHEQTLHMVRSTVADAVDISRLVVPTARCRLGRCESRLAQWFLTSVAMTGVVCSTVAHATCILSHHRTIDASNTERQLAIEITGVVATVVTTGWYLANCQRDLLLMLATEVDAWFAAVHFTIVALCVADILRWRHDVLPILSFQRWFLVMVNVLLMLFHVSLLQSLFFSPELTTAFLNRVLVDFTVSIFELRLEMFSFVTSKIFTSFVWMGRFLWRECVRPRDAFKLVKHRAQYLIPT